MILQVGVKIFLKNKDGKYLLVKRSLEKYPNARGLWDIVGGRIDPGTSLIDNLRREVKEEVCLEIVSEPVLICAQDIFPDQERHIVRLTYVGKTDGDPVLDLSEHSEFIWLSASEIMAQPDLDVYVKEIMEKGLIH
jgi:ADP-ribose pyrophosphatase YjhB (NUDIX family)